MRVFKFCLNLSLILGVGSFAHADHPNEGKIAISQLIEEAEQNSLEIKQTQENLNSLTLKLKSQYGRLSPKVSVEGGPQSTKFDNEKSNATSLYGKAEWNIYNGGSDKATIDLSKSEIDIQEKRLKSLKNKIKNSVSKIYFELQFILESISLKQKALELNSQQMKIAKVKNSSGFTTSSDVLEFDLRESTLQSDLVFLNQQLDQKSRELDVILSRKNQTTPDTVKGHLVRESFNLNRENLLTKIQDSNDQILLSKIELQRAETEKQQVTSQLLPKLDLEARYGRLANDEKVFDDKDNYSVMLKLNIPLFSGFEDYNSMKSVHAKVSGSQMAMEQIKISLIAELDSTLAEIKALNSRLDLEEKNLERSEKYYKLTLDEYRRGIKNSPDMVGASERLLEARIRNLEYRRDLMLAKAKVQNLTGE